jgi:HTH-type transcriptional regulator / antitoxin HigA
MRSTTTSTRGPFDVTVRALRDDTDYEWALAELEKVFEAKPRTPAGDRHQVLVTLIAAYEMEHHPIGPPNSIEAIRFAMDQQLLSRKDLEPLIGSRARVSEILNGKRALTLSMIRALHDRLGIPLESLVGE